MNNNMWMHPATQENLETLRKRGHIIVEPEEGLLACGTTGPGRLAEPERIADVVVEVVAGLTLSRARSGRRDRSHHRRSHAGTARPGALHFQSLQRQDGLCAGRSGRATRRAGDPDFRPGAIAGAARRARGACAHRSRDARRRDGASERSQHHRESGGGGRLSSSASAPAQNQEDRDATVARSRSHARYPGRIGQQERRPAADRIRGRDRESGSRAPARSWNPRIATWWWPIW